MWGIQQSHDWVGSGRCCNLKNKGSKGFAFKVSGDDLLSTPKLSWSVANSDLGHLRHSSDSDHLPVLEMLQSTSYSEPLPAVPNATACSFHSDPSPDTPSNPKSGPMFFENSPSCSGDRATPTASDIKGQVIKVIRDVKGLSI